MPWNGGPCPNCGEEMPKGVIHCRYCQEMLSPVERAVTDQGSAATDTGQTEPAITETQCPKANKGFREQEAVDRSDSISRSPTLESSSASSKVSRKRLPVIRRKRKSEPAPPADHTDTATAEAGSRFGKRFTRLLDGALKWIVPLLLLAPLIVSGPIPGEEEPISLSLPMVHSGAEPHNLILINSVVNDGDLEVSNNYANVHRGGHDAGRKFAGWPLDHHTSWYQFDRCIRWWEVYETERDSWHRDEDGNPVPTLRAENLRRLVNEEEYSRYSPGLAVVLSPFLVPFRKSVLLEPMALVMSGIATVIGFFAFRLLIWHYATHTWHATLLAGLVFLGSPLWHYGRTLYGEPFAATAIIVGYAAALRRDAFLVAGLSLGLAILLRAPFSFLVVPLFIDALARKDKLQALKLSVPTSCAFGLTLLWNRQLRDEWLRWGEAWEWGSPVEGMAGLVFSPEHGILLFAPALLLMSFCLGTWFRLYRREAMIISSAIVGYVLMMSSYVDWWGGSCYSARYLIPILPLMFAPLGLLFDLQLWKRYLVFRIAASAMLVLSATFGAIAAFACENVWNKHPLQLLFGT